jgi:hypothetical protein
MRNLDREKFIKDNQRPRTKKLLNYHGGEINVCHLQGRSMAEYPLVIQFLYNKKIGGNKPENLTIITTETDPENAILTQQLYLNDIPYINSVNDDLLEWSNINKIDFIIDALEKTETEYTLILDGRDVIINTFEGIIEKYKSTGLNILFNSTKNNFPRVEIDKLHDRDWRGNFKYFNAGCCIGETKELLKFYNECKELIPTLPDLEIFNSEQYIIRHGFAKYSEDVNQRFIDFDWECNIFQTFAQTRLLKEENNYIVSGYVPVGKKGPNQQ